MSYSADVFFHIFPFLPTINIFSFTTEQDIKIDETPLTIITGTKSSLYREASILKNSLKEHDNYFEIENATHASILGEEELKEILLELLKDP